MIPKSKISSGKFSAKKIFLLILVVLFVFGFVVGIYLYINFNRLLTNALKKSFETSILSDVYDLNFDNLSVNFILGNIKVKNLELNPKENPSKVYPYINSSFRLSTKKILLTNVEIFTLLNENRLQLERVEIDKPNIHLTIADVIPIFLPFNDSTFISDTVQQTKKRPIEGFYLKKFNLTDASIHVENFAKEHDLHVTKVNIKLNDLKVDQQHKKDLFSYSHLYFYIGEIKGSLKKESIKHISLKNYQIIIDSLEIQKSVDTFIYHFSDFKLGLKYLDLQTADSIFHVSMKEFELSYKEKSIVLKNVAFKPNISETAMQKRADFQITQFSGNVGLINIKGINFDSLMYRQKLFIDEIVIDSVSATVFKDKTKSIDLNNFPEYFGQSLVAIQFPLLLKHVNATNFNLIYRELQPDRCYAKAIVNNGVLSVENITNININQNLSVKASAYLEHKVPFKLSLDFDYQKPRFTLNGSFAKFNLTEIAPLIESFAPVLIKTGKIDAIEFSGIASKTEANGTMKFLYHDLKIDVALEDKAKWKSSVLSFASNTLINSANPVDEDLPPRIVNYQFERNMNKGFFNIIIKSALNGLKETIIMSKENKKQYREAKKNAIEKNKKIKP